MRGCFVTPDETVGETHPNERRSGERQISVLINAGLLHAGRDALCRIRNLSAGGIMVETGLPLGVDDPVRLQLRSGRVVRGTVRWAHGRKAGIAFADPRSAEWVKEKPGDSDLPRSPIGYPMFRREAVARLVVPTRQMRGRIVAISPVGIAVENDRDWGSEKVFTVAIVGLGEHLARRVDGSAPGPADVMSLIFLQPLNHAVLNEWLSGTALPDGGVGWDGPDEDAADESA